MARSVFRMMRHHHDGERRIGEARANRAQNAQHVAPQGRPQRGEGLVEEKQRTTAQKGAGKSCPLALAPGQFARQAIGLSAKAHGFESVLYRVSLLGRHPPVRRKPERDILEDGQMGKEIVVLKDDGERSLGGRRIRDVLAGNAKPAGCERQKACHHVDQGRLAGPARADQSEPFAGRDREIGGHGPGRPMDRRLDQFEGGHEAHRPPPGRVFVALSDTVMSVRHRSPRMRARPAASSVR